MRTSNASVKGIKGLGKRKLVKVGVWVLVTALL